MHPYNRYMSGWTNMTENLSIHMVSHIGTPLKNYIVTHI